MKYFSIICMYFCCCSYALAGGSLTTGAKNFLINITQPTLLAEEAAQACWSPDGNKIAYSYMPGGKSIFGGGILIHTLGASDNPQRLTADGKDPAWSPDGKWIAFVRAGYAGMNESVWLKQANNKGDLKFIAEGGYPQWTPDSQNLIYYSDQVEAVCQATLKDGIPSNKKKLFDLMYSYPRLSPNGEEIAYVLPSITSLLNKKKDDKINQTVLLITDLQQRILRQLTIPFRHILCGWSPDGEQIVFGGILNENSGLNIIDADLKTPPHKLLDGIWSRPSWSPDGRYIAYDSMEDGKLELWIMDYKRMQ